MSTRLSRSSTRPVNDTVVCDVANARGGVRKTRGATKALRKSCPICQRSFFGVSDADFTFHVALCLDAREDSNQRQWEKKLLDAGEKGKCLETLHGQYGLKQKMSRAKSTEQHSRRTHKAKRDIVNLVCSDGAATPEKFIEDRDNSALVKKTSTTQVLPSMQTLSTKERAKRVIDNQNESLARITVRGKTERSRSISQQSAGTVEDEKSIINIFNWRASNRKHRIGGSLSCESESAESLRSEQKGVSPPTISSFKRSRRASNNAWNCPMCNKKFSLHSTTEEDRNNHVFQCDGFHLSHQFSPSSDSGEKSTISSHFSGVESSSSQRTLDFSDVSCCDNSNQATFKKKEKVIMQSTRNDNERFDVQKEDMKEDNMKEDTCQDKDIQEGRRFRSQKAFHIECPICYRSFNTNKTSEAVINRHVFQCSNAFEKHQESYDKLETERLKAALDDDSVSYGSSSDSDTSNS
mmetsp:Transcript_13529/g.20606  ORF Transcript_13529/g.20606 Transcript_13529/m.20606 type:complete len:465 (+) Transcript_13529:50-1444(+)